LFTGINDISILAEIIATFTNTTLAIHEASPVATPIENTLIDEVLNRTGFNSSTKKGDGIMTPGGSYSNMMALLAARNYLFPKAKKEGVNTELVVFTSEHAHYSVNKAANIIGIGEDNVILVKNDSQAKMLSHDLEEKINYQLELGKKPLCILLNSGTTEFGSFDPIEPIVEIAEKYKTWLHVDGAWGGAVLFSKQNRYKLKGIEKVNSFNWDAHKILGIPLYASVFLINKPKGVLQKLFGSGNGEYLLHGIDHDLGEKSLQCARRNDALKVWMLFKYYGLDYIEDSIDNLVSMSKSIAEIIKSSSEFDLIMEPEFLNICFSISKKSSKLNLKDLHTKVRNNLINEGKYFFNYTAQNENETFFRYIVNMESSVDDFNKMLNRISIESKRIISAAETLI